MIEAEKKDLLKAKDEEYEKIVYTRELEVKNLRARLEELQAKLADTVAETLELKIKSASEDCVKNDFENEIRKLKTENNSLLDKINRKKEKIKSLKEDIKMHDSKTKGAGDHFDKLVARNR